MAVRKNSEGPSVLQLQRWDPSQVQLNLSEFREAFISPTRELLVLLSHHCEALLLPLRRGDSSLIGYETCKYKSRVDLNSVTDLDLTMPSRSDSLENIASTSETVTRVSNNEFSIDGSISPSNSYRFVCDVKSLAWGLCVDTYNQHKEALFRELLFVAGNHGVTIHGFLQSGKKEKVVRSSFNGEHGQGRWVEWGTSIAVFDNEEVSGEATDVSRSDGAGQSPYCSRDESLSGSKRSLSPKKWLQSFLTAVETKRSDGLIWTQFPDESVFPSSATVVSFNISFDESLFLGLCCARDSVLNQEKSIVGTAEESYKISETRRYKCSKVFSSESYNVVGFVLTSTHAVADNNSGESDENWSKSILIARIDRRGIQWLCNVKLDKVNMSLKAEWVDFQFSGNFLICLNNFGLIHFYDAMTGAHVLHLDVLRMHAVEPGQRFQEVEKSLSQPQNNASEQKLDVASKVGFQTRSAHQKISFRRLIVASCSSLLAVVDDCGIVYVVCMSDHLAHKYSSFENLQPQYPRLGLLAPWEAGSYDISSQKVFSCLSGHQKASTRYKTSAIVDDCGNLELFSAANWCVNRLVSGDDLNGFSVMSQNDVQSSTHPTCARCIRKYFLPISRAGWEDTICFSPLGITRLIKPDNTREKRSCHIVYMSLHVESNLCDDRCLSSAYGTFDARRKERAMAGEAVDEEAVGCVFQGYLYLVTGTGLSVVLPTVSVPSDFHPIEFIGYPCQETQNMLHKSLRRNGTELWSPWKVVILDRILLHEGPKEADFLCLENGWDLKVPRLRRLQLAVAYLKFEEIEGALESLAAVDMAEEAVLRLIFAAVYLMVHIGGNDSDVSAVSRLLAVATCFATKMIREYATANLKKNASAMQSIGGMVPLLPYKECEAVLNLTRLQEMAHYLEIIRSLQCRLAVKFNRLGRGAVDDWKVHDLEDNRTLSLDDSQLSVITADTSSNLRESPVPGKEFGDNHTEKLALVPVELLGSEDDLNLELKDGVSSLVPSGILTRRSFSIENPKEMIARWEIDNLDLKNVVRDALLSGRLPLAVLQLHLHRLKSSVNDKKQSDTFAEVRDVGRMIAYELFLKGETGLAVETLQRLGEDVEKCLKELLFGTVSRPLRKQIMEEMKKCGYLRSYELAILDRLLLIERIYPSSNFRRTYLSRKQEVMGVPLIVDAPEENSLCLLHPYLFRNVAINCGDIDGVVLGSWRNANVSYAGSELDEDCSHAGYWTAAAVWFNAWDQKTIDRILLDHPFLMGVHVSWESQIEYHICHSDWEEVSKLLCMIPSSLLSEQKLQISLDGLQPVSFSGCNMHFPDYGGYMCSSLELDGVCIEIPNTTILCFPANIICSTWLRMLLDKELAKKFVFLKEYWDSTSEIISVMARSGFIVGEKEVCSQVESTHLDLTNVGKFHPDTVQAIHKLVIHFCTQYNLPYFLDFYLDHHALATDGYSLSALQDAAGDSDWAKWLLFSRVKGHEYDASFYNARGIMAPNIFSEGSLPVSETNEIICTVDDIAEGGWLKAALATLMFAPLPLDSCLNSGSVNRRCSFSAQCTLENLQPALQQFPTLWHILLAACLGQDTTSSLWGAKVRNVNSNSALSIYLNWRDNIFFSSGRDTSLLQMLPCWFPKVLWRLIQLFVQGPLVWQSVAGLTSDEIHLQREIDLLMNNHEYFEISAVSWEAAIHKQIEQELYASSAEGVGLGLEENLHRGRALAAFNHLLGYRVQQLKTGSTDRGESSASIRGQPNVQSDVQTLLQPLTQSEETLLSLVIPLAIADYRNSVLVASCAFLLELCGISAGMLRVDVAALRRIYSFYDSTQSIEQQNRPLPKGAFSAVSHGTGSIADSLAQSLADYYVYQEHGRINKKGQQTVVTVKQNTAPLMLVLQHLEKASLPVLSDGKTCGSWLSSGDGDGNDLRSQQKAAGHRWSLVTVFCRMHQIPLSVKYLALLARDDDWVGFLSEAQVGGYPFDMVIQTAGKEFRDARLKTHVLTVLRTMLSRKKTGMSSGLESPETQNRTSSDHDIGMPVELVGILALCEKKKHPGKTLLLKAKELRWSLLAVMASCFPDVSPLACLTVWLEITEARETSVIREQDIASYITNRVGAAVEATNTLPADDKIPTFHYNRKSPKRRRLVDPTSMDFSNGTIIDIASTTSRIFDKAINEMEPEKDFKTSNESHDWPVSLSQMVAVLCERHQFLPLLRAFEMFLPSCSLLPFVRALQAFSQMRLSEASAHLGSFSARIKEEPFLSLLNFGRAGLTGASWISSTAIKATDAILSTCPSPYEKRCLLNLLAAADFGDGGSTATYYRRQYWKINLAEAALRKEEDLQLGNEMLDDASLLMALEKNGHWEQARNWARQLEASGGPWKSVVHHVTETQAESMVVEWKEFLWDEREERVALWAHCHTLFIRYSFPALQAGLFFLKHAEAVEQDLPPSELHELLLLSLQWLSGTITQSHPVCPLHLLREIETRVWLLAVESEAQLKRERGFSLSISKEDQLPSNSSSTIDRTANVIASMDSHMNAMKIRLPGKGDVKENNWDAGVSAATLSTKSKRRAKALGSTRRTVAEVVDKGTDLEDVSTSIFRHDAQDENLRIEAFFSRWEERVGPAELERAVLSLLEFGQITAAKQLQHKFSDGNVPFEFQIVDTVLKLADLSTPPCKIPVSVLDEDVRSVLQSYKILTGDHFIEPLQVLESASGMFTEGGGYGLCKRIIAVVKAANVLGISFSEAFEKQPTELLQLLSLKAQDSFEETRLLVQTHSMPATSIAQILAESFLKGLLAAHRGGYIDSQREEGPAPLLWRFSDFLKWADLCPSEPEVGHALMRLVVTGQGLPHVCEVELLILSHHFYQSSACLDGVDVLVALAATRVEAYASEGDFSCLARLITGVGNFHALSFILGILIENGQLELLLQKFSAAAEADAGAAKAVRGFRMAVLTALKHFNPNDLDAFATVYNHFDMKHETASLLESRAEQSYWQWFLRYDRDQNEDLLEAMRYYIEAAEVHSSIDAGRKTRAACAQASLVSLQIRMPDIQWLNLSDTNARRLLVEQSHFQEALIVAEAYNLNQPTEWALVLWNQMHKPELLEEFVSEFVGVLPLHPSMLNELARFYKSEMAARGDQSQFSVWLSGGGFPAEWAKYMGRSFRCLLKRTRDLRLRLQLANVATGFVDVVDVCNKLLDKVPENAGPLVLRKGHGGAYLPLM